MLMDEYWRGDATKRILKLKIIYYLGKFEVEWEEWFNQEDLKGALFDQENSRKLKDEGTINVIRNE